MVHDFIGKGLNPTLHQGVYGLKSVGDACHNVFKTSLCLLLEDTFLKNPLETNVVHSFSMY